MADRSAPPATDPADCVIVGGGPAGVMAGLLLARAGREVVVLEKHADFFRDFRGDTIHPATLTLLSELGLLERFLELPHQKIPNATLRFGNTDWQVADFTRLRGHPGFIALLPQWDFLDFLVAEASRYPGFRIVMQAEGTRLIEENGRVLGVRADTPGGVAEYHGRLVIAADGRHSRMRDAAGLESRDLGAPIDVLWMRIPRAPDDPAKLLAIPGAGRFLVMIYRGDYWQCANVIGKGRFDALKAAGLDAFRKGIRQLAPFLGDRVDAVKGWDDVKLLTVRVDRLTRWHRPGLLVIGDAAHAMSPVGGVGINLAIQDAVAAANTLAAPLAAGTPGSDILARVQRRREWPARLIQRAQVVAHNRFLKPVLASEAPPDVPLALKLLRKFPALQLLPAYAIGVGPRPEHVRSREAPAP